jgi:hypothetical protein
MTRPLRTSLQIILIVGTIAVSHTSDIDLAPKNVPSVTLDATVKLSGGVLAAGIGYKWGHGTLYYQGQELKFCIRGLSVGDVGAANLAAEGAVFNLKSLDDFPGKYFALSGGFAIARGESAAILKTNMA